MRYLTIILLFVFQSAGAQLYENYFSTADGSNAIAGVQWRAQSFTVGAVSTNESHSIDSIAIYGYRDGAGSDEMKFEIKAVDGSGFPTGAALSTSGSINITAWSTSADWRYVDMSAYTLSPATQYALVVYTDDASGMRWSMDVSSSTYPGGAYLYSGNSGTDWLTNTNYDFLFRIYGTHSVVAGEHQVFLYDKKYQAGTQLIFHDNHYGSGAALNIYDIHYGIPPVPPEPSEIGLYAVIGPEDYDGVCPDGSTRENDADCASETMSTAYTKVIADPNSGYTRIYIDPTYSGTESGTEAQPYNSFSDFTITSGRAYLFKRGTTTTITSRIDLTSATNNIVFGAYSTGSTPIITTSSDINMFYIVGSADITVRDLDIRNPSYGANTTTSFQVTGGIRLDVYNCNIQYQQQAFRTGSGASLRVIDCEIQNIYSDGFICYSTTYLEVGWCNIHDINEAYYVNENYTEYPSSAGDGIQINAPVNNIWYHNTTIDRSNAGNKATFMAQDHASNWFIEYCIIVAPQTSTVPGQGSQAVNKGGPTPVLYMKNNLILGNMPENNYSVGVYGVETGDTLIGNSFIGLDVAMYVSRTGAVMLNNSFYDNTAAFYSTVSIALGAYRNNILFGNIANFTNVTTPTASNNLLTNPSWNDPAGNDLSLTSGSTGAIDLGYSIIYREYDPLGVPVPQNTTQDIGAYEYQP